MHRTPARRTVGCLVAAMAAACLTAAPVATAEASVEPGSATAGRDWSVTQLPDGAYDVRLRLPRIPVRDAMPRLAVDGTVVGIAQQSPDGHTLTVRTHDPAVATAGAVTLAWAGAAGAKVPSTSRATTVPAAQPERAHAAGPVADPAGSHRFAVTTADYDLGDTAVDLPALRARGELRGRAYFPSRLPGRRLPVVVLLHGRHAACYGTGVGAASEGPLPDWPCPAGSEPVPSYAGYDAMGRALAASGQVVVSISADAVNALDYLVGDGGAAARAELVLAHLDLLARWDRDGGDPFGGVLRGQLDLRRVGLMGHSRGGEGVVQAALLNRTRAKPYGIAAVLALAPVDFQRLVLPDTALNVLLPYCDGDVVDLQGAHYVEDARYAAPRDPAQRSALLVMGANHNFFNTEWTPGLAVAEDSASDDWPGGGPDDAVCGAAAPSRLTAAEQRAVGAAYVAGFFRLHLAREDAFLPLFDGSGAEPASVGRAVVETTLAQQPQRARRDLAPLAGTLDHASTVGALTAEPCAGAVDPFAPSEGADPSALPPCVRATDPWRVPDWGAAALAPSVPATPATHLSWSGAGALHVDLVGEDRRARRYDALTVRLAPGETATGPAPLSLRLIDNRGVSADVPVAALSGALTPLPGLPPTPDEFDLLPKLMLRQVVLPLRPGAVPGVDLGGVNLDNLAAVELRAPAGSSGEAYVSDLSLARSSRGTSVVPPLPLLRVGDLSTVEGDAGTRTIEVPVTLSRPSRTPVTAYVDVSASSYGSPVVPSSRQVTFRPGSTRIEVPVQLVANLADDGESYDAAVVVSGVIGALPAKPTGSVHVRDDDDPAHLVVGAGEGTEGPDPSTAYVSFPIHLSAPAGSNFYVYVSVTSGTAVVDQDVVGGGYADVPLGGTDGEIVVPILDDDLPEPDEDFTLDLVDSAYSVIDGPHAVQGVVHDDD